MGWTLWKFNEEEELFDFRKLGMRRAIFLWS
ncbi:hypothetical protein QG37_04518 [Candidozyma auris]|uniref:Uncharacterized protein n=1 Tax=Candidozyma auris TaxID=498019 RepID=A0A0L0NWR8_CANAR|nr:hypothetical protein QG37_04518 [[Candida] auris]